MNFQEIIKALHEGHVPPRALNKKAPRYSATTVKTMDVSKGGCERRHFFEQVCGIEPAPSPRQKEAFAIGTALHSAHERYYKKGELPRSDLSAPLHERLASKALPFLPPSGTPGIESEKPFECATWPGGPTFTGTPDLVLPPNGFDADGDDDHDFVELWDYKTTGNYPRYAAQGWALTAKTLPDDLQLIAYGRRVALRFRAREVRATWLYHDKSGGPVVPVRATLGAMELGVAWRERVLPLVEKMERQHKERPALRVVPANEDACGSYGGCPHKSYCVDYKETKIMGRLSDSVMKEHKKELTKSETKEEAAPALNPPASKASPFLEMSAEKEAPKKRMTVDLDVPLSAAERTTKKEEPKAPTSGGFALFLGCEPIVSKRPKVLLASVLAPLEAAVAKANKVAHIGLVKYDAAHHLCAALDGWLADNAEEWDGVNVVVGRSALHVDVAERVLLSRAVAAAAGTV